MTERPGNFLFIENREKTWFWDAVAAELERRGHKISWIVQNRALNTAGMLVVASFALANAAVGTWLMWRLMQTEPPPSSHSKK